MTDRELLERAAKAAGYELTHAWSDKFAVAKKLGDDLVDWNPLDDDGDAFRLMSELCISIQYTWCGRVIADRGVGIGVEGIIKDRALATRRAIVRAAATVADEETPR